MSWLLPVQYSKMKTPRPGLPGSFVLGRQMGLEPTTSTYQSGPIREKLSKKPKIAEEGGLNPPKMPPKPPFKYSVNLYFQYICLIFGIVNFRYPLILPGFCLFFAPKWAFLAPVFAGKKLVTGDSSDISQVMPQGTQGTHWTFCVPPVFRA